MFCAHPKSPNKTNLQLPIRLVFTAQQLSSIEEIKIGLLSDEKISILVSEEKTNQATLRYFKCENDKEVKALCDEKVAVPLPEVGIAGIDLALSNIAEIIFKLADNHKPAA